MATTKKTQTQPQIEKVYRTCIKCGLELREIELYKNRNELISDKFSICKKCACSYANKSIENFHSMLRMLNIVFDPNTYETCNGEENLFSAYMLRINNPKKKNDEGKVFSELTYDDSPTYTPVLDVDKYLISSDGDRLENIAKWGEHYSQAEYLTLNKSVENNIKVTGRDDYQSIKNFERVARAEVERDRAYANSSLKPSDKKSAEDNVTNMMKQAGLSYEQTARNSDFDIGCDIRDIIENYEPVPTPTGQFKDVDFTNSKLEDWP